MHGYFKALRIAGAQARRVLLDAVAAKWNVPVGELVDRAERGRAQGLRTAASSYGEIAAFAKAPAELPKIEDKDLKPPASFRLHRQGRAARRAAAQGHRRGEIRAWTCRFPGMVYAAVLQSPYPGGAPETVDDAAARKVPGITDVVRLPGRRRRHRHHGRGDAGRQEPAQGHLVDAPGANHDSERALDEFAAIGRDKSREGVPYETKGDAKAAMAERRQGVPRRIPHALRLSRADGAAERHRLGQRRRQVGRDLGRHAGSPSVLNQVARLLQTDRAKHHAPSACPRRRFRPPRRSRRWCIDAVRLSKAVGKPVKLIWSREDDIAFGKFRPMTAHHIEAGFDADGKLIAWHHRVVAGVGRRLHGRRWPARTPAPTDRIVMKGSPIAAISDPEQARRARGEAGAARGSSPWRGVGNGHNAFAIESFLDEMAKELGKDPIAFRLELSEGAAAHADAAAHGRRDVGLDAQARRHARSASPSW